MPGRNGDPRQRLGLLGAVLLGLICVPSAAAGAPQDPPPAPPFALNPSVSLADVGIDTNPFTTPDDPQQATTGRLTVQVQPALRSRIFAIDGKANAGLSYVRVGGPQRSFDTDDALKVSVNSGRLTAYGGGAYSRSHDQFDPEVYTRVGRTAWQFDAGSDFRLGVKTTAGVAASHAVTELDDARQLVLGAPPQDLVREVTAITASVRNDVTPLTSISLSGGQRIERAGTAAARDVESLHLLMGVDLKPDALIDGHAYVGVRRFPDSFRAQDRDWLIGSIDLGHVFADVTRLSFGAQRDISESFRVGEQSFVSTRVNVSLTTRVSKSWTLRTLVGREWLAYTAARLTVTTPTLDSALWESAIDDLERYGLDATCRLGIRTELKLSGEYVRMQSAVDGTRYDRVRALSTFLVRF